MTESGYVENGTVTNAGVNALEPYRAKRAIFITADFSSRSVPATCACSLATMKRDGDGTLFLKSVAWFGVVISAVFMVLQLVPIPRLSGVNFCMESYILLQ